MTYSLWMLTTQLPSVPRTWCPPTILVFICTKHDILGLVRPKQGDILMLHVICMNYLHFNGKIFIETSKANHKIGFVE